MAILKVEPGAINSTGNFAFGNVAVGEAYFVYNSLLLSANGTNLAQNNTFLDSSASNFTVTRNGNPTQGSFSPYGNNWSNYFNGSGDSLRITRGYARYTANFTPPASALVAQ